jgi:methionyl-tRNA formyltransferase
MKNLRIVFMGTPDFAVPSLEILVEHGFEVVGVVTTPDRPAGRGMKLQACAVKQCALKHGIPVLTPEKLKAPDFLEALAALKADLQVVVAFRMLPEVVWAMPPLGTFNLHGSLLPQYRGAAPINWAVINGETETGVTTFFLQHEIDTGNLIFQDREPIAPHDTAGSVHDRLMQRGAALVLKTVQAIAAGNCPSTPQQESTELKKAPKLFTETCRIDFGKSAEEVRNLVRGLAPYPAAWTSLHGKTCKLYQVSATTENTPTLTIGEVASDGKSYLRIGTANGYVSVEELQLEGKKRMTVADFLRGNKLPV